MESVLNENYVCEFLELFIIGKGFLVGLDDYINFIELDVLEIVRVLIGWRDWGFNIKNFEIFIELYYINSWYDFIIKILFYCFDNMVVFN